ncbi:hypothetical protein HpMMM64_00130 [Helicobacter pylori]
MVVFCKAILGLLKENGFKTLPIPYEVYYQTKTKFKKQVFKSKRTAKKLKMGESLKVKLQTL